MRALVGVGEQVDVVVKAHEPVAQRAVPLRAATAAPADQSCTFLSTRKLLALNRYITVNSAKPVSQVL